VWCPASNDFLFGRTVDVRDLKPGRGRPSTRVALGTDSRISGARDLLAELKVALAAVRGSGVGLQPVGQGLQTVPAITADDLFAMVTRNAADILRVPRAGRIAAGLPADLIIFPPYADGAAGSLLALDRRDLRLVLVGGRPLVGDPALAPVFSARQIAARPLCVDGTTKLADASLVRRIAASSIDEPGVSVV
jgi:cytosine/adenosine deaminase-related metal-dependent hydrolase